MRLAALLRARSPLGCEPEVPSPGGRHDGKVVQDFGCAQGRAAPRLGPSGVGDPDLAVAGTPELVERVAPIVPGGPGAERVPRSSLRAGVTRVAAMSAG